MVEMTLEAAKDYYSPENRAKRGPGRPSRIEGILLKAARRVLEENGLSTSLTPTRSAKVSTAKVETAKAGTLSRDEQIENFINSLDLRERNYVRETLGEIEIDEESLEEPEIAVDEVIAEVIQVEAPVPSLVCDPTW